MADTVRRMDRAEITKRVERAEKLLQKGKTAEALEDYLQVLAAEPGNDTVCQMAADLCLSLQRIPQAVKLLGDLYERQIEAGDATRASLTYKKLARFVTPTWEQKLRFGELQFLLPGRSHEACQLLISQARAGSVAGLDLAFIKVA